MEKLDKSLDKKPLRSPHDGIHFGVTSSGGSADPEAVNGTLVGTTNGYTYYKFTSTSSSTFDSAGKNVQILVAGGGGGTDAHGGAGGAGGVLTTDMFTPTSGALAVVVGAKGNQGHGGQTAGTNGGNSSYDGNIGGGGGAGGMLNVSNGNNSGYAGSNSGGAGGASSTRYTAGGGGSGGLTLKSGVTGSTHGAFTGGVTVGYHTGGTGAGSGANGANSITNGGNGIGGNSNSTLQSFLTDMNTLSSPYGEYSGGNWYINGGGGAWQWQNSATPRGGLGNIGSMFASVSVPANSGGGGMANLNGMIGGADGLVLIRHA